jgi:hypothetical protein
MKSAELFRIEFDWTVQQDHAGVNVEIGLAGYSIAFTFYDCRHWDTNSKNWVKYD